MKTFECQALLFDLDGTLIDSIVAANRSWQEWGRQAGLGDNFRLEGDLHGLQRPAVIAKVRPDLTKDEVQREASAVQAMEKADTNGVEALPGSIELLESLPIDRWAIVTSADREVATARLRSAGLPEPTIILSSDEIANSKPDPSGYLKAAEILGFVPADCIVVEDAPAGIQAATKAGMRSIACRHTQPDDQLSEADAIVDDMRSVTCEQAANLLRVSVEGH